MSLTKTILLPYSFHSRDGATSAPFILDANNNQVAGRLDVIEHPPGTALTFPADVANRLLDRFGKAGAVEIPGDGFDVVALAAA